MQPTFKHYIKFGERSSASRLVSQRKAINLSAETRPLRWVHCTPFINQVALELVCGDTAYTMSDKRYAYVALSSDPNCNTHPARDPRFSRSTVRQYLPWLAHMILLAVSMSLFAAGVSMRTAYHRRDINEWGESRLRLLNS